MRTSHVICCSIALVLCILQREVSGLHCYECNSHNDSRCAFAKLPDSMRKDCALQDKGTTFTMCRKITQIIEFEVNGMPPDSRVIRGCGWDESNYKGRCYQRSGFGGRQEVCSCLDDNCNSAPRGLPQIAALAAFTAALYFLFSLRLH